MNKGYTRRDFIKTVTFGLGSALSGALSSTLGGCATICSAPISWSPTVLAPVFYGYEDYAPSDGAPADFVRGSVGQAVPQPRASPPPMMLASMFPKHRRLAANRFAVDLPRIVSARAFPARTMR